jgi:hypothetical protein
MAAVLVVHVAGLAVGGMRVIVVIMRVVMIVRMLVVRMVMPLMGMVMSVMRVVMPMIMMRVRRRGCGAHALRGAQHPPFA